MRLHRRGGMKMLQRVSGLATVAMIAGSVVFGGAAFAADINRHTIKFASTGAKGAPIVLGMEKFAEILSQKSGGQITVKSFPNGTLGGDVQTISALQGGTIEMTTMNAGLLSGVAKDFPVVALPFLFNGPAEADAVMDGPVGKALADLLPEKGLIGLAYGSLDSGSLPTAAIP